MSSSFPPWFVAVADTRGCGGCLVVVDSRTGRVLRTLTRPQPGGGVEDPFLTADRSRVIFSRGDGSCASHLATVPADGGNEARVDPTGASRPRHVPALSSDGSLLAFVESDCESSRQELVLARPPRFEVIGRLDVQSVADTSWSPDGNVLAVATGTTIRLLQIVPRGPFRDAGMIRPPGGCALIDGIFDSSGRLLVLRRCGRPTRSSIVEYTRSRKRTILTPPSGQRFGSTFDVDASGRHLLYSTEASIFRFDGRVSTRIPNSGAYSEAVW